MAFDKDEHAAKVAAWAELYTLLNTPLKRRPGESTRDLHNRYLNDGLARRNYVMGLLLKFYGIAVDDPRKWEKLAVRLAQTYVPAMQSPRLTLRGRGSRDAAYQKLFAEVKALMAKNKKKTIHAATKEVGEKYGLNPRTLANAMYRLHKNSGPE